MIIQPSRRVVALCVLTFIAAAALWLSWYFSPKRELERCQAALSHAKSWHAHEVQPVPNDDPINYEKDFVCPSFEHVVQTERDQNGVMATREWVLFEDFWYTRVDDGWNRAKRDNSVVECKRGPLLLDFDAVIYDSSVHRGEVRNGPDGRCRDCEVVSTGRSGGKYIINICINEQDHLPREIRRPNISTQNEELTQFTEWNVRDKPELPPTLPTS